MVVVYSCLPGSKFKVLKQTAMHPAADGTHSQAQMMPGTTACIQHGLMPCMDLNEVCFTCSVGSTWLFHCWV
jgi:hypothetical protein